MDAKQIDQKVVDAICKEQKAFKINSFLNGKLFIRKMDETAKILWLDKAVKDFISNCGKWTGINQ